MIRLQNLKIIINKIYSQILQIVFPLRCPVCDKIVVPYGEKICTECIPKLKLLGEPWCIKCGKKLNDGAVCKDCERGRHVFDRGRSVYEYQSAALSIYRFKYSGRREYADYYGEQTAWFLQDFIKDVNADCLVPIPLHSSRYRKRGYNQALDYARAISKYTGIPVKSDLLYRVKKTTPLKELMPSERQNNLKKAFIIKDNDVKFKTIILIDDIYTTGATIDEAARVLKVHGADKIYFITLASGAGV